MISVCFITKNEERWIGECIRHLRPIVDDFVVFDTGSTDQTCEIVEREGARLFRGSWPGDFSTARNRALAYAKGDWILKIDPDERLDETSFEIIRRMVKSVDHDAFRLPTRAYTNERIMIPEVSYSSCRGEWPKWEHGYVGYREISYTRLFRNIPGVRYEGLIHEGVDDSLLRLSRCAQPIRICSDFVFHHYGCDPAEIKAKHKTEFYYDLMEKEVQRSPENAFVWSEYAGSLLRQGRMSEAVLLYERALSNLKRADREEFISTLGLCLKIMGRVDEALVQLKKGVAEFPKAFHLWLNLGVTYLESGHLDEARNAFEEARTLSPSSAAVWRALGQWYSQMGKWAAAEAAFLKSLSLDKSNLETQIDLGILYFHHRKTSEAQRLFNQVCSVSPENERALHFLALSNAIQI